MNVPPLACTVRGCAQPLARERGVYRCPRGHTYDVARTGYVNLLQPQDRRAAEPGDARAAVDARVAVEQAGAGDALLAAVIDRLRRHPLPPGAVIADLGCGTGHALARICAATGVSGIGIDLSAAAIGHAARRHPELTWVVANADRRLPLLDGRVNLVLSLHARRNPAECARVLAPGGILLVAVPAPGDLAELRAALFGTATDRDRVAALVAEHDPMFALRDCVRVTDVRHFEPEAQQALLRSTYRAGRAREAARAASVDAGVVTLASDVCVFEARPSGRAPQPDPAPDGRPATRPAAPVSGARRERGPDRSADRPLSAARRARRPGRRPGS